MIRILRPIKDTTITDKVIHGERCTDANVGQAGTLDLFKLYDETYLPSVTGSVVELSRLLVAFDYDVLRDGPMPDKATLKLVDVYGGQTTPSNFTIDVWPLSRSFEEGRGSDVVAFRDLDVANWLSASNVSPWATAGAAMADSDYYTGLGVFGQSFARGDEDLEIDVVAHVSASLVDDVENHGFRVSFSQAEETDEKTWFVKRFGSAQAYERHVKPTLMVEWYDYHQDDTGEPLLNSSQSFFMYSPTPNQNFYSGSLELSGANCMNLVLATSKSVAYMTSSWSMSHSASINHLTHSREYYSASFSVDQVDTPDGDDGVYRSEVFVNSFVSPFSDYLSGSTLPREGIPFLATWRSLDDTVVYHSRYMQFKPALGVSHAVHNKNLVLSTANLRDVYSASSVGLESQKIRVYAQYASSFASTTMRTGNSMPGSCILRDLRWRIKEAYTKKEVIPFGEATRCSYDADGMWFDLFPQDLFVSVVYQIDFAIHNEDGSVQYLEDAKFRFKVIS